MGGIGDEVLEVPEAVEEEVTVEIGGAEEERSPQSMQIPNQIMIIALEIAGVLEDVDVDVLLLMGDLVPIVVSLGTSNTFAKNRLGVESARKSGITK